MYRVCSLLTCAGMPVGMYVYTNSNNVLDKALFALSFDPSLQN